MTKHTSIGIGAAVVLLIIGMFLIDILHVSAEEAAYKAAKARQKAMQAACERVIEKVTYCYSGSKEDCLALQESNTWFRDQFDELPEMACPNAYDPL